MPISNPLRIGFAGQNLPYNVGLVATAGHHEFSVVTADYIPDHTERALSLLIEEFERLTNIDKYVKSLLIPYQDLEITFQDMKHILDVDTAIGNQLNIIGEIVGEDRNFRNDDEYRDAIKVRIFINKSNGEPETVRSVTISITKAVEVKIFELEFAQFILQINTVFELPDNLRSQIESVSPTGVKILFTLVNDLDPDFGFEGEGGYPRAPNTLGFGETGVGNELEGGKLVEILDI